MSKASRHIIIPEVEPLVLPTGTISMSQVNVELGRPATQSINLNDAEVRKLAGRASGAISMNDLRGKSAGWSTVMTVGKISAYGYNYVGYLEDQDGAGTTVGGLSDKNHKRGYIDNFYLLSGGSTNSVTIFIKSPTPNKTPLTISASGKTLAFIWDRYSVGGNMYRSPTDGDIWNFNGNVGRTITFTISD